VDNGKSMRLLSWLLGSLAFVGCGFDPPAVDPIVLPGAGAPSTSGAAGTAPATGGSPNAGSPGAAGSTSGSGGTTITPQGGSAGAGNLGGAGNAGGGAGPGGSQGMAGTGGAGGSPTIDPAFKSLWRDEFDSFDTNRWSKATHTFPENKARFSANNAVVEGGFLKLRVSNVQNGDKPYSAAEVLSKDEFTFGRFEGRIKFCAGSGMVSSLFTYKEDVNQSWQEIDIEHLGHLPKSIQYNLISGTLANRKYQPKVVTFQYAPPADFHDYAIEWRPEGITFFVDGVQTHKDVQDTLKDAARLHMNAWPTDNAVTNFAGPLDTSAIPCEAQYDWVQVWSYQP
jgi:endo-1,3-1,4-beta-glycanase ExoK